MRILLTTILAMASQLTLAATITVKPGDSLQTAIEASGASDTILIRSSDVITENLVLRESRHILAADGFVPVLTSDTTRSIISIEGSGYEEIEITLSGLFIESGSADHIFELVDNTSIKVEDTHLAGPVFGPLVDTNTPEDLAGTTSTVGTLTRSQDGLHSVKMKGVGLSGEGRQAIADLAVRLEQIISDQDEVVPASLQQALRFIQAGTAERLHTTAQDRRFTVFDYLAVAAFRIIKLTYNPEEYDGLTEDLDLFTNDLGNVARNLSESAVIASNSEVALEQFENANAQLANGWHYEALTGYGQAWRLSL